MLACGNFQTCVWLEEIPVASQSPPLGVSGRGDNAAFDTRPQGCHAAAIGQYGRLTYLLSKTIRPQMVASKECKTRTIGREKLLKKQGGCPLNRRYGCHLIYNLIAVCDHRQDASCVTLRRCINQGKRHCCLKQHQERPASIPGHWTGPWSLKQARWCSSVLGVSTPLSIDQHHTGIAGDRGHFAAPDRFAQPLPFHMSTGLCPWAV